jgi:hypothetical protein
MAKNNKGKAAPMPQRREEPKTNLGQGIRIAGVDGVSKKELNIIADTTGKSSGQIIQKLDQINKNLKQNDKAAIGLGAAASNMLIRQASKQSPTGYNAYMSNIMGPAMGTGRFGTELQRRATEFGTDRNMSALVPGGQYMMPSGRTANVGFGPQYELPKTTIKNPIGGEGYKPSMPKPGTEVVEPTVEEVAPTEITPTDTQAPGMLGIGVDLANWATGFRRAGKGKGKGIRSTSAASRSTRSVPSSKTLGM